MNKEKYTGCKSIRYLSASVVDQYLSYIGTLD
eukprot:SAG11_NODE_2495_length_3290_cov_25.090254_3_plen_32_part_00